MALDDTPQKLESAFIQRNSGNQFYEQVNISGSDLIVYHSSSGELTADRISVWVGKYGIGRFSLSSSYASSSTHSDQAGYATASLSASWASSSISSSYSFSSSYAVTASYAVLAKSASYSEFIYYNVTESLTIITSASYASSSTYSNQSAYATASLSSSWASSSLSSSYLPPGTYDITSSWARNALSASFWDSSSIAIILNNKQWNISTGSTLPITASWSNTSSRIVVTEVGDNNPYMIALVEGTGIKSPAGGTSTFYYNPNSAVLTVPIINAAHTGSTFGTASWARNSLTASAINFIPLTSTSASWASSSISSSYALRSTSASYAPVEPSYSASISIRLGTKQNNISTGSTLPITASFATSASFAVSASWAPSTGTGLDTGSIYPFTSSWAETASVSLTSLTASYFYRASGSGAWKIYVNETFGDLVFDYS